jgi:putative membrane protein
MEESFYSRFGKDMILRDYLAVDRTLLANENTLLAYIRTAIAFFVAGVSFVRFFDNPVMAYIGWALVPIALATVVIGAIRYQKMRTAISKISAAEKGQSKGYDSPVS